MHAYPHKQLAALTDAVARAALLTGAHSLWYEHVCLRLQQALDDLKSVELEESELCAALAE